MIDMDYAFLLTPLHHHKADFPLAHCHRFLVSLIRRHDGTVSGLPCRLKLPRIGLDGAAGGTRTPDPIITNDMLYRLSYNGAVRSYNGAASASSFLNAFSHGFISNDKAPKSAAQSRSPPTSSSCRHAPTRRCPKKTTGEERRTRRGNFGHRCWVDSRRPMSPVGQLARFGWAQLRRRELPEDPDK